MPVGMRSGRPGAQDEAGWCRGITSLRRSKREQGDYEEGMGRRRSLVSLHRRKQGSPLRDWWGRLGPDGWLRGRRNPQSLLAQHDCLSPRERLWKAPPHRTGDL